MLSEARTKMSIYSVLGTAQRLSPAELKYPLHSLGWGAWEEGVRNKQHIFF